MQNSKSLEDIEVVQLRPGLQTMAVHRQALRLEVRIDLPSPPNIGSITQLEECRLYKSEAVGSSPTGITNLIT